MSDMIAWIRAEAERPEGDDEGGQQSEEPVQRSPFAKNADGAPAARVTSQGLVAHQFPT